MTVYALFIPGQSKDDDEMTGVRGFFCRGQLRDQSARWLVFPKLTPLKLQGRRLQGCYYPLDKSQLEWQMSINDISKQVEEEQSRMMQANFSLRFNTQQMLVLFLDQTFSLMQLCS